MGGAGSQTRLLDAAAVAFRAHYELHGCVFGTVRARYEPLLRTFDVQVDMDQDLRNRD